MAQGAGFAIFVFIFKDHSGGKKIDTTLCNTHSPSHTEED